MSALDAYAVTGAVLVSALITGRWLCLEADRLGWSWKRGMMAGIIAVILFDAAWMFGLWRAGVFV